MDPKALAKYTIGVEGHERDDLWVFSRRQCWIPIDNPEADHSFPPEKISAACSNRLTHDMLSAFSYGSPTLCPGHLIPLAGAILLPSRWQQGRTGLDRVLIHHGHRRDMSMLPTRLCLQGPRNPCEEVSPLPDSSDTSHRSFKKVFRYRIK